MPNHHKLIGLVAIVIIASVGGVSYAALGGKPETTQVQQTPTQTTATSSTPPDTTAAPTPATAPTPTPSPAASNPTPAPAQTAPKPTGSSGTSGGGTTTPAPTPTPTPPPAPTYTYRNGTYNTVASYGTPGGSENLGVTLTITNDIITTSSLDTSQAHGDAAYYQGQFAANYQPSVVSKALAGLNLSRVAGASLTTNAFNSALNTIRNQAKN